MKLKSTLLIALSIAPTYSLAALGPIVITPSAYEQPLENTTTPITIIDQQTIENSGATSIAELLRGQSGIHINDLFGDGSQATVDLRGFGPTATNNTLILIDGRRLNNSIDSGIPDLSTINIANIKQIEILQGSAGVLYGHQAIGGVINIISKDNLNNSSEINAAIGSYNAFNTSILLNRIIDKTQLSFFAKSMKSDNFRDNNDADKNHVSIKAKHAHNSFTSYLEIEKTDDHLLAPGALLLSEAEDDRSQSLTFYDDNYFDTITDVFRLGIDKEFDGKTALNIDFSLRKNDREFNLSSRPFAPSFSTQDREVKTVSTQYIAQFDDVKFSPTIVIGFSTEKTDYVLDALYLDTVDQTINAIYLSSDFKINAQSFVNFGMRTSQQSADITTSNSFSFGALPSGGIKTMSDDQTVLTASYTHKLDNLKIHVRADQNFRFPSVEEHTNVASGDDIGLKTQTGTSFEIGSEININQDAYRMTYYQLSLENELGYDESFGTGFNLNLDDTKRKGIILEANNQFSEKLSTQFSVSYLDAELTDGAFKGNTLPLVAEKSLRFNGHYQVNQNVLINLEFIQVGEQIFGGDYGNTLDKLESYQVINSNIKYSVNNWDFALRINNLLNEEYSESGNLFADYSAFPAVTNYESYFTAPNRNYWLNVNYKF